MDLPSSRPVHLHARATDLKRAHRRQFLHLAAGAAALPLAPHVALAQAAWPARPVRVVVGFAAGGPNDILARLLGQWLSERLGQPFIIENKPGASGNIATELVARSAPDGYTLQTVSPTNAINATLFERLNFDFARDITPVATIFRGPFVVTINPTVPARTVPEFLAYAKANPGKINYASVGNGSPAHLSCELLKMMTGIDMVHVPYRGGAPAITDAIAGQVQLYFVPTVAAIEYIRGGQLRALAVTTLERAEAFPDLPSIGEFVPGFQASIWFGIGAPRNTPADIVGLLNKEINAGLMNPKIKEQLVALGGTALTGSPAEFRQLIADETAKWAKVIKFAGIKPV